MDLKQHAATHDKTAKNEAVIALAGNPNVGKSTVFNALTGMHQHTGNWPGKTVGSAYGRYTYKDAHYILVDIPGTYSLVPHSAEEEVARDFLCFNNPDATVIVCDATCLMRNLNLVFQTIEITPRVIVCVNLMDEARKKGIHIDCKALSRRLGVPVVPAAARSGTGLLRLTEEIHLLVQKKKTAPLSITYRSEIEAAINAVATNISSVTKTASPRFWAIRLLSTEEDPHALLGTLPDFSQEGIPALTETLGQAKEVLLEKGYDTTALHDAIVSDLYALAEKVCENAVHYSQPDYNRRQLLTDRFFTGKATGIPVMIFLLLLILWLTICGANYPSQWLSAFLFGLQKPLSDLCLAIGMPLWIHDPLIFGIYRVLAWVVSVMLPPMAIFFPLFSLAEDAGYLPRVAFNLDHIFQKCNACGKQALTMCMGFGCNAVCVMRCRIIDSPRERLIAILTNNFVPCNGRFPTLSSIITMFFIAESAGFFSGLASAALLTGLILLGIAMTVLSSRMLSKTLLKGVPSSFTLELPPYRRPQIGKVLIRSLLDRTLFVLGRAVSVAAPAGLVIYLMANLSWSGHSLLSLCAGFLDPFAQLIGLDGVILMAFILGFPANEIVMPIAIMAYLSGSSLTEFNNLTALRTLLIDNGWTWLTAACTMIFSLMHWPCSTTLLTIKKETGSLKWTAVSFLLPTLAGILVCFLLTSVVRIFG